MWCEKITHIYNYSKPTYSVKNRNFDGTLNNFGLMVFEFYRFKDMLLQLNKSCLILAIIKEAVEHESIGH